MVEIDTPPSTSSPTWSTLETCIREHVQSCLQRVLDEDVGALLGRGRHERRSADAAVGSRNGYGTPRQVALMNGTITIRRPRVRGLDARFESRILPLFQRRTPEIANLLPELDLHGLSSGDTPVSSRSNGATERADDMGIASITLVHSTRDGSVSHSYWQRGRGRGRQEDEPFAGMHRPRP
jgi:hypothetical protein